MGASGWEYVVPYQPDLGAALDALRHQVFASGEYVKPDYYGDVFDLPEPSSVEDLLQEQYAEFIGTSGTHSIIDMFFGVVPASVRDQGLCTIRPLTDAECVELFGTAQPGRADYTPLAGSERLDDYVTAGRWKGRAVLADAEVSEPGSGP